GFDKVVVDEADGHGSEQGGEEGNEAPRPELRKAGTQRGDLGRLSRPPFSQQSTDDTEDRRHEAAAEEKERERQEGEHEPAMAPAHEDDGPDEGNAPQRYRGDAGQREAREDAHRRLASVPH